MESIFRWLAAALAGILEKYADPQLQARLDAFNLKVAAVEARAKEAQAQQLESERAYAESTRRREELDARIVESNRLQALDEEKLVQSRQRQEEIRNETQRLKDNVDSRSDDDAFSGGVPKSSIRADSAAGDEATPKPR